MGEKAKQAARQNADLALAFVAPIAILLATFALLGVYPFGERSVNNLDLYHQYLPIMAELQRIVQDGGSIFYSFNAGLGTDFYALSTYQNMSPVTWVFLALFPQEKIVLCAICLILFKIGLIAVSMYWYLKFASTKEELGWQDKSVKLALACMFALSGYVLAYYTNVMWLDSLILAPLCVAGLRKVVEGFGGGLYMASVALLLFTCYYIGAMVCLFLALYYLTYFFGEQKECFAKTTLRLAGFTVVAVLIAMVVLLPTFFALQKTMDFETVGVGVAGFLHVGISEHIRQLLPGCYVTVLDGPPNLYAGIICLILLVLFALQRGINVRKRVARIVLIAFVFISTNVAPLDLVWHFFHSPNSFPARYSFLLAFLLVETAAEVLDQAESFSAMHVFAALGFVACLYIAAVFASVLPESARIVELESGSLEVDTAFLLVAGAVLLVLYGFVFLGIRTTTGKLQKGFLAAAIAFEVIFVAFWGIGAGNIVKNNDYGAYREEISQLVAVAQERNPYARVELLGIDNSMLPYVYGYKGASIFASSVPQATYDVLAKYLPGNTSSLNHFEFTTPDLNQDSLLNIRSYISIDGPLDVSGLSDMSDAAAVFEVAHVGDCYLYESSLPSALGFMLPAGATIPEFQEDAPTLAIEEMAGNKLVGSIDVRESGTFFVSIPYDAGWRVQVDGAPLDPALCQNVEGFISFNLDAGSHRIDMTFVPTGFNPGLVLSIFGLVLYAALAVFHRND